MPSNVSFQCTVCGQTFASNEMDPSIYMINKKKNTFAYITCLSVCGMVVEVMWCVGW